MDSEVALGGLVKAGYTYQSQVAQADIAIVNTCGFTQDAKQESIDAILELAKLKKAQKIQTLVIMGCLSQRYGQELMDEIKEADIVLGSDQFQNLPDLLEKHHSERAGKQIQINPRPRFLLDQFSAKKTLTPKHFCYVKISEGCINACSYCAIPSMKGRHRSRAVEDIVQEAVTRAEDGTLREINLIGQDTAAYGFDLERRFLLPELLSKLAQSLPEVWIRTLYAHPAHVTSELYDVFKANRNICSYVDLPIEHSHPEMLKRMNRGVTREKMDEVIEDLRKIPGMILRTAVIVGFPGETKEEFQDLLDYMKDVRFERLGAFTFSREEGTRAFGMPDQIPQEVQKERFNQVMELQKSITSEWNQSRVGQTLQVLVEESGDEKGLFVGRTAHDAPEVDGSVFIHADHELKIGDFVDVHITEALDFDLIGEPV